MTELAETVSLLAGLTTVWPADRQTLAYVIGAIGILVEWRAYYLASGRAFRHWSAAGALLWAGQYLLLGAWTAGLTMASTAVRTLLSGVLETPVCRHWAVAGFIAWFSALTVFSWQGQISLLPAFAVINTTWALFYLGNRGMRIALLASALAWLGNDYYWQAWPALLAESVAVAINLRTIRLLFSSRTVGD